MSLWQDINAAIERATGSPVRERPPQSIAGGGINRTVSIGAGNARYFVKLNDARASLQMFEAEAAGLRLLAQPEALRVPQPICFGTSGTTAYLILEHIELGRGGGAAGDEQLGIGLAAIHRVTRHRFGWDRDNTIGSTPQINRPTDDWVAFYRDQRLGFQFELAERNGYAGALTEAGWRLLEKLPVVCAGHHPAASLLHGDLWGGNAAFDGDGVPVIYDPAVYFGDRETDLAMTELFGGFSAGFYRAYQTAWPLAAGYERRRDLYQLYHVLNHLNLFGAGYAGSAKRLIDRLLAAAR